jgi:hypothetical protein
MRCEECGRPIKNAEMWQLGADRNAPTSRSMRQLCWDCREKLEQPSLRAISTTARTVTSKAPAA